MEYTKTPQIFLVNGALQYLTLTRSDLSYVVQQIFLFMHDPREPHLMALKRISRSVKDTLDMGLQLFSSSTTSLVGYSDANWAGCPTTRRSTSSYCIFLGNNLSQSVKAEYRGVTNLVVETCWIRNLLRELHLPLFSATLLYHDNVSTIY
ncbi:uncharacterized mitochondrial protein AtMg00810-like [Rutidosis leptorrhynchoides]|uniref:uncharacterized mitochondrial protein AtMg00810-like n=1 Tax=Rutidosis leptorrhynchoides TaxID=125765 RepID=UPI003A99B30F